VSAALEFILVLDFAGFGHRTCQLCGISVARSALSMRSIRSLRYGVLSYTRPGRYAGPNLSQWPRFDIGQAHRLIGRPALCCFRSGDAFSQSPRCVLGWENTPLYPGPMLRILSYGDHPPTKIANGSLCIPNEASSCLQLKRQPLKALACLKTPACLAHLSSNGSQAVPALPGRWD